MSSTKQSPLDWLPLPIGSPDIHAPHPDLFELELDSSIVALPQGDQEQLQLLNIEFNDPYSFLRSETPRCGPGSAITASSESTYDSFSSHSESFLNYTSPPASDYNGGSDYPVELAIDFSKFSVDVEAIAAEAKGEQTKPATKIESNLDEANNLFVSTFGGAQSRRGSYQLDMPPQVPSMANAAQYVTHPAAAGPATISPAILVPPSVPSQEIAMLEISPSPSSGSNSSIDVFARLTAQAGEDSDPRKKYRCPHCPRAFARAYNLKTHLQTHDPNRLKPHMCPHKTCGRSFSRKHDLGRHMVSIHRDDPLPAGATGVTDDKFEFRPVGVAQGDRKWCDDCGASIVGPRATACACQDVS